MRAAVQYRTTMRSVAFLNCPGAVYLALQRTGAPSMRSPSDRGAILVPIGRFADVAADLEAQGRRLELVGEVLPL